MPGRVFTISPLIAFCALASNFAPFPNANPGAQAGVANGSVRLQFPNTDVCDVLGLFELQPRKRIAVSRRVITIAEPVEYRLPGVSQIEVKSDIGLSVDRDELRGHPLRRITSMR